MSNTETTASFLDVEFHWTAHHSKEMFEARFSRLLSEIQSQLTSILKRQGRKSLERYDLITYISSYQLAAPLRQLPEWAILEPVLDAVASGGDLAGPAIKRFVSNGPMRNISTEIVIGTKDAAGRKVKDPLQHEGNLKTIYHLRLEDEKGSDNLDAWCERCLLLLAMLEVRECLVQTSILGRPTIAKCKNKKCGSWFNLPPMSSRSQFCSTYCRVAHSRQKG